MYVATTVHLMACARDFQSSNIMYRNEANKAFKLCRKIQWQFDGVQNILKNALENARYVLFLLVEPDGWMCLTLRLGAGWPKNSCALWRLLLLHSASLTHPSL